MDLEGNFVDPIRLLRATRRFLPDFLVIDAEVLPGEGSKPELQVTFGDNKGDNMKAKFVLDHGLYGFFRQYDPELTVPSQAAEVA
jgi:hypothetical protein